MSSPSANEAAAPAPPCVVSLASSDPKRWFAEEVHPHDGQLKAWLRGQFPAFGDVDDVVQESYLRIWKARANRPIQSAKAFLFRVARNLAVDHLRKESRTPLEEAGDLAALDVVDPRPDAAEALLAQETLRQLADAVIALPAHYRNVIILHKIQGLPQKDVAARVGLSERSVDQYVRRGILRCEAYLRERGIENFLG